MTTIEPTSNTKAEATVIANPLFSSSTSSSDQSQDSNENTSEPIEFMPFYHAETRAHVNLDDYFHGPRDIYRHSKLPYFMRLHGSVMPKMIIPMLFVGGWATLITCISKFVHNLGINSVLLTVTGFVVGLALSFRSSTAYERYSEGRKYWAQLLMVSRQIARLIWVHAHERFDVSEELGKSDLLAKLAAMGLLNAFAVSLKHRLRFEPSPDYPDLAPLIGHVRTLAHDADTEELVARKTSSMKAMGQYLGVPFAESNPRKVIKRAKDNLGNIPLEILTHLAGYMESIFENKTLTVGIHQVHAMNNLAGLTEVLTGVERVVNTPLPIAYSISISQITWAYVLALPFQLVTTLQWVAIPGTMLAGYIILGLAQIGRELENPFGEDVNDLPLDHYCQELANDIDALTSRPAPRNEDWMRNGGAKLMWPLSSMDYKAWEARPVADIRRALKAKATSRDVARKRANAALPADSTPSDIVDRV